MKKDELNQILLKFKPILGLDDEKIKLVENYDNDIFEARIDWNKKMKIWEISYKEDIDEYYIIHELGHIYLSKKYSYKQFVLPTKQNTEINYDFFILLNGLVDGFVDYNLSLFPNIYPLYINKYREYIGDVENAKLYIIENQNYIHVLSWYILWYQSFYGIFSEIDLKSYENQIKNLLLFTKSYLLKKKDGIKEETFKLLNRKIKRFNKYKEYKTIEKIQPYFYNILNILGIWDIPTIKNQIKLYFTY